MRKAEEEGKKQGREGGKEEKREREGADTVRSQKHRCKEFTPDRKKITEYPTITSLK